jgi:arylsulfatase A-like enzyme
MTLKLNGYATAQFGKCHEVPGVGDEPGRAVRRLATGGGGTSCCGIRTARWSTSIMRSMSRPASVKAAKQADGCDRRRQGR